MAFVATGNPTGRAAIAFPSSAPPFLGVAAPPPPFNCALNPTGAPPRYSRIVNRDLRWPLIIASGLGLIWALAVGVDSLRDMGDDGETSYQKMFDLMLGILYLVVAGVEAFVILVAAIQNIKLAKFLRLAAPVGVLVAVAACVLEIVGHYLNKTDLINECAADYVGGTSVNGDLGTITPDEAVSLCDDAWSRGTWRVYAWLVVVSLFAIFIAGMTIQYYRRLKHPTLASNNQSIPLESWSNNPPPPSNWGAGYGQQQQPWQVPPYPGPPPPGQEPFEKGDYQPAAEWAQAGYAPPPGPPPASASRDIGEHRAEEEAWERARTEGVTAHLTGHGPNRSNRDSAGAGFVVGNTEEDEAWERARTQGVTAHLTGHQKPRRDYDEI